MSQTASQPARRVLVFRGWNQATHSACRWHINPVIHIQIPPLFSFVCVCVCCCDPPYISCYRQKPNPPNMEQQTFKKFSVFFFFLDYAAFPFSPCVEMWCAFTLSRNSFHMTDCDYPWKFTMHEEKVCMENSRHAGAAYMQHCFSYFILSVTCMCEWSDDTNRWECHIFKGQGGNERAAHGR